MVELVRTATSDSHRLDGVLFHPTSAATSHVDLDACILLHGVGGNFYSGSLFDHIAAGLTDAGLAVLRVNTRGHDSISISWGSSGPVRHGAAYEVVDQCRYDVNAWVAALEKRGCRRIGLLGHSLGAIKAIYSQAWEPNPAVQCVVACSAPRLSHSAFMNSESQPRFFESLAIARENVDRGQPEALFQARFPFPVLITATGYIDKYGPEERYNILRFIDRVQCPLLVTYGQLELDDGGIAFAGMINAVQSHCRTNPAVTATAIPGADHAYAGVQSALVETIRDWLSKTLPV